MSRIIVTGGAGFIGSNFVRLALAETAFDVVVVDRLTYAGNLANLDGILEDARLTFQQADIAERPTVRELYREHEPIAVLNFAAESHVDRSIDDPGIFVHSNIVGTFELLEGARHYLAAQAADRFRFLQVSTDEVYGSLGDSGLFTEQTPYAPNSPYSASKASADHLVRAYSRTYGLPTLTTNCTNNYGPHQYPEKLIPLMVLNALEGKSLPIYGDGLNVRDWLYVEDHCRGLLAALERGRPGDSYNFGGNAEHSNLELVDRLCGILDEIRPTADNPAMVRQGFRSYRDLKQFVEDRPGHDQRYAMDITKVRAELGWEPRVAFEEGLRRTVQWYLDHPSWCSELERGEKARRRLGLTARGEEE